MNNWRVRLALCALLCAAPAWGQIKILNLKNPVPLSWVNFAFSQNGKAMAANYGGEIFRWTATGYVPTQQADGWWRSDVFARDFLLTQDLDPLGQPRYTLEDRV